jgi:hypothetical protein
MIPGSPPKRLRHKRSLITTTLRRRAASSGLNVTPAMARTPRTSKNCDVTAWPAMRSASPPLPVSVRPPPAMAATDAKACCCSLQSRKFNGETRLCAKRVERSQSMARRSACAKGRGRTSAASTRLNIALFAPMPMASTTTATAVKPGALRNERAA